MANSDIDGWESVDKPHRNGVVYRPAGEGKIPAAGMEGDFVNVLVDGTHTRGMGSFLEYTIAPHGKGPGLHWHRAYDELFYVVVGTLKVIAAGVERTLQPRDFVFVPRGVIHSFWNVSDEECVFVSGWTPPGAEQIFIQANELIESGEATPAKLQEMFAAIDGVIVDEP
ncbi:cupin domain-containing protein [Nocardia salmonicida]|uniref:cupin domain-containing protein n=1 Tax=Nocardia salmonicida TaxID=53431 RepID=UPI00366E3015